MALTGALPNPMKLSNSPFQSSLNKQAQPETTAIAPGIIEQFSNRTVLGQPLTIFLGLVLLLFGFKYLSESSATEIDPFDLRISGYNVVAVGVTAMVFFTAMKVLFNRFKVPGITDIVNFV